MDSLNMQVLQGFGVKAKKILKEKSYYICNTNKGLRLVRKSFDNCENIAFQHSIKEHLYNAGFIHIDKFYLSNQNKPYVEYDGNIFVMTEILAFRESDFSNNQEFEKIVETTSIFHKLSRNITFPNKVYYGEADIINTYKKNLVELNNIKKKLSNQKRLSDFDVLFLKNYVFYIEQIRIALEFLDKTDFNIYLAKAMQENRICHNLLKEENMLFDGNNVYLLNFSHSVIDYEIFDIANIVQRYIRNIKANPLDAKDIIKIYDKSNPFEKEEVKIIYPLLLYPGKFIKLCCQYYSKKRTWTPSAITNRMEDIANNRDEYYYYADMWKNL